MENSRIIFLSVPHGCRLFLVLCFLPSASASGTIPPRTVQRGCREVGMGGGAFRPHHATLASANSLRSTVGRAHQHKGTDGRTDKLTDGQTDGRSDRRTDGWIDVRVGRASSLVPTPIGRIIAEGCWVGSGYFSTFQSGHFPKPLEVHETRFIITPRKGAKHDLERTTIITY